MADRGMTDAEMAALETSHAGSRGLTDDEMLRLEASHHAGMANYDPMQSLADMGNAAAQGATFGHYPQIRGAIEAGDVSGPTYEKAKAGVRDLLAQGRARNAPLAFTGQVAGSSALPFAAGLTLPKVAGPLYTAIAAALQGAAQNPGGDVDEPGAIEKRGKQALAGGIFGAILGKLQGWSGPAGERQAVSALGPSKRDILIMRQKGTLQDNGREILDQGVIGNLPRGKEVMLDRAREAAREMGQRKSDVIKVLDDEAGSLGHIDTKDIADGVVSDVSKNTNLPGGPEFNQRAQDFADSIGRNSANGNRLSLADADALKTATGKDIGWLKTQPNRDTASEALFKSLYARLNAAIDSKANWLTKNTILANPNLDGELQATKRGYGAMTESSRILDSRISAEEANRVISPSDYGMGAVGAVASAASGTGAGTSAVTGFGLGALNKIVRTYGNQFNAKQLDNASKVLNYSPLFNAITGIPEGIYGTYNRSLDPKMSSWGLMRTTRD